MQYVGKISREIYRCVTEDITADEVMITDERIAHIQSRHPIDYDQNLFLMKDAVENPDYIIYTEAPNTAFILKEFSDNGRFTRTIMRLHTSADEPGRKNSIITFQHVKEHEYHRLLRNKRILYRRG